MAKNQESRKAPAAGKVEKPRKTKSTSAKTTKSDNTETRLGKAYEHRARGLTNPAPEKRGKAGTKTRKTQNGKGPKTKGKTKAERTDGAGVTENAPYSDLAEYRMITTSDDVVNSSGS